VWALATTFYKNIIFVKCCNWIGNQKLQEGWRAEQNKKQGVFAFSAKNWVLFCGGLFLLFLWILPSIEHRIHNHSVFCDFVNNQEWKAFYKSFPIGFSLLWKVFWIRCNPVKISL